jgi:hypothetical protein
LSPNTHIGESARQKLGAVNLCYFDNISFGAHKVLSDACLDDFDLDLTQVFFMTTIGHARRNALHAAALKSR